MRAIGFTVNLQRVSFSIYEYPRFLISSRTCMCQPTRRPLAFDTLSVIELSYVAFGRPLPGHLEPAHIVPYFSRIGIRPPMTVMAGPPTRPRACCCNAISPPENAVMCHSRVLARPSSPHGPSWSRRAFLPLDPTASLGSCPISHVAATHGRSALARARTHTRGVCHHR